MSPKRSLRLGEGQYSNRQQYPGRWGGVRAWQRSRPPRPPYPLYPFPPHRHHQRVPQLLPGRGVPRRGVRLQQRLPRQWLELRPHRCAGIFLGALHFYVFYFTPRFFLNDVFLFVTVQFETGAPLFLSLFSQFLSS